MYRVLLCGITNQEAVEEKIRESNPDLVLFFHYRQVYFMDRMVEIKKKLNFILPHRMDFLDTMSTAAPGIARTIIKDRSRGDEVRLEKFTCPEDPEQVRWVIGEFDKKRIVYLKYLFNDNGPNAHLDPEIVRGVHRESKEYGRDSDAEYVPLQPYSKPGTG